MEEDTGKSLHVGGATGRIHGADHSLVDYNRAGIPLIEIVTKPIQGAGEKAPAVARAYVAQLRDLILALGVSEARMDQGSCAPTSTSRWRPKGSGRCSAPAPRPRTSTRSARSSGPSATRCSGTPASSTPGGSILQETRHWHEDTGVTTSGREKSDADDYRYFPEPDLVPVAPSREWVEELRGTLPENPLLKRARLQADWGYTDLEMRDVVAAGAVGLIEETVAAGASPQAARKWWLSELARRANDAGRRLTDLGVTPAAGGRRPGAGRRRARSTTSWPARSSTACSPARAPRRRSWRPAGWRSSPTRARSSAAVDAAIAANPDVADKIRDGKVAAAGALIGAVMKEMRGQADAGRVRELILEKLS